MSGRRLDQWEAALRRALDAVDHALESRFGEVFPRRASRPPPRTAANPKYDGLFTVDGKFSLGLVSRTGPGYVIDIHVAAAVPIPPAEHERMLRLAEQTLRAELAREFPGRHLEVHRERHQLRVTGDLSL